MSTNSNCFECSGDVIENIANHTKFYVCSLCKKETNQFGIPIEYSEFSKAKELNKECISYKEALDIINSIEISPLRLEFKNWCDLKLHICPHNSIPSLCDRCYEEFLS